MTGPVSLVSLDLTAGELVVQTTEKVHHKTEVAFSFTVFNPATRQNPSPVFVKARAAEGGQFLELPPRIAVGLVLMADEEASFTYTDVSESAFVLGALNRIEIALRSNVHLEEGSELTISGLTGSATESNIKVLGDGSTPNPKP